MNRDDIKEIVSDTLLFVLIIVVFFGVFAGIGATIEKSYCGTMESIHDNFEFQWVFFGGCLVKTPSGFWINAHEYQYLEGDVR